MAVLIGDIVVLNDGSRRGTVITAQPHEGYGRNHTVTVKMHDNGEEVVLNPNQVLREGTIEGPTPKEERAHAAAQVIEKRMAASDRGEEKGGASDDEIIVALTVLLSEAHDFISNKVKNPDRWPLGMRAFRMNLLGRVLGPIFLPKT